VAESEDIKGVVVVVGLQQWLKFKGKILFFV
jgi:hypothetical protein